MSTVTNLTPWGYHGIFDCSNCDSSSIQTESTIRACLTEIASLTADSVESEAFITVTGRGNAETEGFSAVQLLNTGNITANFINHSKHMYIDVFSHKEFTASDVEVCLKKYFGSAININKIFLPRKADAAAPN